MKKILAFLLSLFCFLQIQANNDNARIELESETEKVIVFLQGAQVFNKSNVVLGPGVYTLALVGLTADIDQNSIQVKGKGDFTILSVNFKKNFLKDTEKPEDIIQLEDSLEFYNGKLEMCRSMKSIYDEEYKMIVSNKTLGEKGMRSIEDIEDLADFYRNRLSSINQKKIDLTREEKTHITKIERIKNQLNEKNSKWNRNTGEIEVEVGVNTRTNIWLEYNFMVFNAGWIPAYELRSTGINEPLTLKYNARVYQNTGLNWKNVRLTLSTGNPRKNSTKPNLPPYMIGFYETPVYAVDAYKVQSNRAVAMGAPTTESYKTEDATTAADFIEVTESLTNIQFEISIPYSIPSDGKRHLVYISENKLKATYTYYAVPKLSPSTFLIAQVSSWGDLNLLAGEANIYNEGTFVGKSYIYPQQTSEKIDFSLGIDESIVVKREKIKEYSESKLIGSNKKESMGFEIQVKNNKKASINIEIEDQIPVSKEKDIVVEVDDISGAVHTTENGKLKWKLTLNPNETKTHLLKYSVKYPKDKKITL